MTAYIVFYTENDLDWQSYGRYVFGTYNKDKAITYREKANKLLKKWKDYFNNIDWDNYDNIQEWQRRKADRLGNVLHFGIKEIEMR